MLQLYIRYQQGGQGIVTIIDLYGHQVFFLGFDYLINLL